MIFKIQKKVYQEYSLKGKSFELQKNTIYNKIFTDIKSTLHRTTVRIGQ